MYASVIIEIEIEFGIVLVIYLLAKKSDLTALKAITVLDILNEVRPIRSTRMESS